MIITIQVSAHSLALEGPLLLRMPAAPSLCPSELHLRVALCLYLNGSRMPVAPLRRLGLRHLQFLRTRVALLLRGLTRTHIFPGWPMFPRIYVHVSSGNLVLHLRCQRQMESSACTLVRMTPAPRMPLSTSVIHLVQSMLWLLTQFVASLMTC